MIFCFAFSLPFLLLSPSPLCFQSVGLSSAYCCLQTSVLQPVPDLPLETPMEFFPANPGRPGGRRRFQSTIPQRPKHPISQEVNTGIGDCSYLQPHPGVHPKSQIPNPSSCMAQFLGQGMKNPPGRALQGGVLKISPRGCCNSPSLLSGSSGKRMRRVEDEGGGG